MLQCTYFFLIMRLDLVFQTVPGKCSAASTTKKKRPAREFTTGCLVGSGRFTTNSKLVYTQFTGHDPTIYRLDMAPLTGCNRDHQDYEPFLVGDPNLNLHFPVLLGGGHIQFIGVIMHLLPIVTKFQQTPDPYPPNKQRTP